MKITVNGEERNLPDGCNLLALLENLALSPERVAIERNRQIVPRERWSEVYLKESDTLEIVQLVGGG
jgi:thiamine biosynthesis protein ThiS